MPSSPAATPSPRLLRNAALLAAAAATATALTAAQPAATSTPRPAARPAVSWQKQILTTDFVAEGCAVADFDRDGHPDVTAGRYVWHGPDFKRRSAFTPERNNPKGLTKTPYNPATGYSDYFLAFAHDFNGDAWPDILVYELPGEPAWLYLNPGAKGGDWPKHALFDVADNESPGLQDIDGDGHPDLLLQTSDRVKPKGPGSKKGGQLGYAVYDPKKPTAKALFHGITPLTPENEQKYFRYTHGLGAGDMNGDGRIDLLTKDGWFEQPAAPTAGPGTATVNTSSNAAASVSNASSTSLSPSAQRSSPAPFWTFHPGPFAPAGAMGGAQMHACDVNGDGRADVITSYAAHSYGLGWFEQLPDGSFREHRILGRTPAEGVGGVCFSQIHAVSLADIDGDGLPDIVAGKRRWAHGTDKDDEPNAAPVLYWFQLRRDGKGGATYTPHLIDDDSGVGMQVLPADIDRDGRMDVVVANKKGVFVFRQK